MYFQVKNILKNNRYYTLKQSNFCFYPIKKIKFS
jgi:hypothetical protein